MRRTIQNNIEAVFKIITPKDLLESEKMKIISESNIKGEQVMFRHFGNTFLIEDDDNANGYSVMTTITTNIIPCKRHELSDIEELTFKIDSGII